MDRTSAQPQVNLSLLRSISLKFQPLVLYFFSYCAFHCISKFVLEKFPSFVRMSSFDSVTCIFPVFLQIDCKEVRTSEVQIKVDFLKFREYTVCETKEFLATQGGEGRFRRYFSFSLQLKIGSFTPMQPSSRNSAMISHCQV